LTHRLASQRRAPDGSKSHAFKLPVGLPAALRNAEISMREVLAAAGLSPGHLQAPRAYVPPERYYALWSAIRSVSGDPNIGIVLARSMRPDITEPFFLAIMSARDVAGAVDVVARFRRFLDPQDLIVRRETRDRLAMIYQWPACSVALPQVLVDAELSLFVEVCRRGTGDADFRPREVQLTAATLDDGSAHAEFFRCPLRLRAKRTAMIFAEQDLAQPFGTHNPDMLSALMPYLRANMPKTEEPIALRVRSLISARMRGRRPEARAAAKELAMSTRALQRLLKDSGTSFRVLLDEVRNEHAKAYLTDTAFTDREIAFLLGFEDPNSFYRAFRAWNGRSPGAFRTQRSRQQPEPRKKV
jgi:AraC-like DNA-binding protein